MTHSAELDTFVKRKEFFVAIDSDGCVFDTMEVKHKECFCPVTIRHFGLQAVSRFAREAWEFVNLYSVERGTNRFPALVSVMDHLSARPVVSRRGVRVPEFNRLRTWIKTETRLGNPALREAAVEDLELAHVLRWSEAVNQSIAAMGAGVPPFPFVVESLTKAAEHADLMVASSTPVHALRHEWTTHSLASLVQVIAGQEMGSKAEQLARTARKRYARRHMLMIGDAYGDYRAAQSVGACFYPIVPGEEESSWERLHTEALDRFYAGTYAGAFQDALLLELERALPTRPPWIGGA